MGRKQYMDGKLTHQAHYMNVARAIGLDQLTKLVLTYVADKERLTVALRSDEYLNNIPLDKWDNMHVSVRGLVSYNAKQVMHESWEGAELPRGSFAWSLSETVSTLKAVARYIVTGEEE